MYPFLPYGCRSLYTMKTSPELIQRCICQSGCSECFSRSKCGFAERRESRKKGRKKHLKHATEENVLWEEAKMIPALFDLFVDNNLLNVVFEWEGGSESEVVVTNPRVEFEVVKLRESKETWPITEEAKPLYVIKRYENCDVVIHRSETVQRVEISSMPNTAVDFSLNFAFQVEVNLETTSEFQASIFVECEPHTYFSKGHIDVTIPEVREECNIRTKTLRHPKYFCRSCSVDICKDCLQERCLSHNVQWVGNQTFRCAWPHHRLSF